MFLFRISIAHNVIKRILSHKIDGHINIKSGIAYKYIEIKYISYQMMCQCADIAMYIVTKKKHRINHALY